MVYYTPEAVEELLPGREAGLGVIATSTFLLSIVNAPADAYWWKADYDDGDIDSDWLRMDQSWYCPYDPDGATDLHIIVYDKSYWHLLHRKDDLGPIYSGYDYVYNCDTEQLTGGPAPPPVEAVIEDIRYWDSILGKYVDEPPELPVGNECGARCNGRNRSDIDVYLSLDVTSYDPFGTGLTSKTIGPARISPGGSLGIYLRELLVYPGTYTFTFELFVGEDWATRELVDIAERIPVAYATGVIPPLEGHLYGPLIHDITTGEHYPSLSLPAEIPSGHEVIAGIHFMNDGELAVLKARVELVDPDGIVRIYGIGESELDTGEHTGVQTGTSVELDKGGTWKIHATLEAEGTLLDEKTWDAIQAEVEFKGTITKKEFQFDDWTTVSIPFSVPLGKRGGVLVTGTNNMATSQRMGISWEVKDPDGVVVHSLDAWEMWPYTGPGAEHTFLDWPLGQFSLDKIGTYTIKVDLLMNHEDPVIVDTYDDALCTVTTEIPPEYELIHETIYHFAYIYDGEVEDVIATFKTDPFTPSAWAGELFASKMEEEYRARGGNVLEVRVYVDKTPLLWTDYRIELIGTTLGEEVAAARGIGVAGLPIAVTVLIIALAIIAVIVVATLMWERFQRTFQHKPGLEDVKIAWGKEALILDIQDAEAHWERTPTPPETLGAMSEAELRDVLDQIAEEEVPPLEEVPWGLIAVAGVLGLGVVGVGAALAARRKG